MQVTYGLANKPGNACPLQNQIVCPLHTGSKDMLNPDSNPDSCPLALLFPFTKLPATCSFAGWGGPDLKKKYQDIQTNLTAVPKVWTCAKDCLFMDREPQHQTN
jgi:hypothetical protein